MPKQKAATTTSLSKWDAELAAIAASATKTESAVGGGNFITMANGTLKYQGAELADNELEAVIVHHCLVNMYYEGRYDPDNTQGPVCWAFADGDDDSMAPLDEVPNKQSDECKGCEQNEFGTADVGKGKACKNSRRLALYASSDLEDLDNAELAFMHLPVTSVKGWAGHVRKLAASGKPPLAVITKISCVDDEKTQFKILFKTMEEITDPDVLCKLIGKNKELRKDIKFPFVQIAQNEKPARGSKRTAAKPPAKKKGFGAGK